MIKDYEKGCSGGRTNTSRGMSFWNDLVRGVKGKMRRRNKQMMKQCHQLSVTLKNNVMFFFLYAHTPRHDSLHHTLSEILSTSAQRCPHHTPSLSSSLHVIHTIR